MKELEASKNDESEMFASDTSADLEELYIDNRSLLPQIHNKCLIQTTKLL